MKSRLCNYSYLLGATLIKIGLGFQIYKTYSTQSAEDLAIMWFILLAIGECFTSPRIFTSIYGVWKLAQIALIIMILIQLVGVVLYR